MKTLKECAYLLNTTADVNTSLNRACVDTRLLQPGDLFFALPGSQTDGHFFLNQAASQGAAGFIVDLEYKGDVYGVPCIRVPNVLKALQHLAKQTLAKAKPQVVAVTGSVGKTTTKEFLAALLQSKFNVMYSPGNSNSQIGLPLAILNNSNETPEIALLEMGLSEKGQISELVKIAPPDIAIITTTALVHAQNFDSLEAIGEAKAEIFSHPKTRLGILDHEIPNFQQICKASPCFKVSFSTKFSAADYYLEEDSNRLRIKGQRFSTVEISDLKVQGKHNRHNFLAAAIAARHLGMTWEEIDGAASNLVLPKMRLEIVEKSGILFINDSYNASEKSVKAALESLSDIKKNGKKVAVLGEMLELGKFSDGCHRSVGEHSLNFVDAVVCYGEKTKPIQEVWQDAGKPVLFAKDFEDLIDVLKSFLKKGDTVLLKGSRSNGLWNVLKKF